MEKGLHSFTVDDQLPDITKLENYLSFALVRLGSRLGYQGYGQSEIFGSTSFLLYCFVDRQFQPNIHTESN